MAYADLMPFLVPALRDCPDALVLQAIHRVSRDFCLQTEAWRMVLDPIDLVVDQADYDLVPDLDTPDPEIVRISVASFSTTDLAFEDYDLVAPATLADPFQILLADYRIPQVAEVDGLTVEVVLAPRLNQDVFPAPFQDRWSSTLVAGVLASLLNGDPRRDPWADPERAREQINAYQQGKAEARRERDMKGKNGMLRAIPQIGWAI